MAKSNIDELSLKMDVEIIKPYLTSKGYDFTSHDDLDHFAYHVARKGDVRYLSFGTGYFDGYIFGEADYKYDFGQIIYDINGNVLLDCLKTKSSHCRFWLGRQETYEEIESSDIFMDDIAFITEEKISDIPYYSIYKMEDGKYTRIGEFNQACTEVEKTSGGELFVNNLGRLFGVRELKFVNDLKFKDIIGVTCGAGSLRYDINNVCSSLANDEMKDIIVNTLKNNDVLFAYDYIYSTIYYEEPKNATIFVFLDTKGNITGKLFVKSEREFYSLDVSNDTYEEVKKKCINKLNNIARREIANERRKNTRNYNLRRESNKQMMESITNNFNEPVEPQGVTRSLKPKNKKQKH